MSGPMLNADHGGSDTSLHMREPTPHVQKEKHVIFNRVGDLEQNGIEKEPSSVAPKRITRHQEVQNGMKLKKSRIREGRGTSVPNWRNDVSFDEKDDVMTIDAEGKEQIVNGPVHPRDVWNNTGVSYIVHFNKFNQPIRKGGDILVKFLGDVAKKERFCPVGVKNWHEIHKKNKAEIIKLVRGYFVIPQDEVLDKGVLHRVDKSWRQHRYSLKNEYFNINERSLKQIYDQVPDGITRDNWIRLVDYWDSPHGKDNAKFKVEETLNSSSSSKSKFDIENEVFDELMYEGEIPERPINYGFGVKQSNVFGVQGLLRKEAYTRSNNNAMDLENLKHAYSTMKKENEELRKQNQDLATKFDENTQVFKTIAAQMADVLNVVRSGKASNELLEGAQSALLAVASQVSDASSGCMSSKFESNSSSDKPTS